MTSLSIGILVGGQAQRLGGVAKGLLPTRDGRTVLERLLQEIREAAPEAAVVLLGDRPEYANLELPILPDCPPGIGPLGGLRALLHNVSEEVVLLGGDMPYLQAGTLKRLLSLSCSTAVSVKTGRPARWNPMFSRYNTAATVPVVDAQLARGRYGLYALLDALQASCLPLSEHEERSLRDWDTPADLKT